jgi:hypothetical protein
MTNKIDWKKKEEWQMRGKDCLVTIVHIYEGTGFEKPLFEDWEGDSGHRWYVYAYIYDTHPSFSKYKDENLWKETTQNLPLHCGASYFRSQYCGDGSVFSIQVGADYNHFGDSFYTRLATKDEAADVFSDAEELLDKLNNMTGEES